MGTRTEIELDNNDYGYNIEVSSINGDENKAKAIFQAQQVLNIEVSSVNGDENSKKYTSFNSSSPILKYPL